MDESKVETLAIPIGASDALDARFASIKSPFPIPGGPPARHRMPGPDVLLVASGSYGGKTVYVVVGVLKRARLSADRSCVEFVEPAERFVVPILASNAREWVDPQIEKYWGNTDFYWLPRNAAEYCQREALRLMHLGPVDASVAAHRAAIGSRVRALYENLEALRGELEEVDSNLGHVVMHAEGLLADLGLAKVEADDNEPSDDEEPIQ